MEDSALYVYIFAGIAAILFYRWRFVNLYHIPTYGPSLPILSYIGAIRVVHHAREILREGYRKYEGGIFKIATFDRWLVIVTGPKLVDDLSRATDEQVSFSKAAQDLIGTKYTFGLDIDNDPLHIEIIRTHFTKNLDGMVTEIQDEVSTAMKEWLPMTEEYTPIHIFPIIQQIVARTSSRVLVGLPLCRNQGYLDLALRTAKVVVRTRSLFAWFPEFLRPVVGYFVNESDRGLKEGQKHIGPVVEERLEKMREYGDDWPDKPNDILQRTIDTVLATGRDRRRIIQAMLVTNFAAMHTSSHSFAHALQHLATNPEILQTLRAEADAVIEADGWTKTGLQNLHKLDSFMRESQRYNGVNGITVARKTLKEFVFSDGSVVPPGVIMMAPAVSIHLDDKVYDNAEVFDPWRFCNPSKESGERTKFVSTSVNYIPFGHGKRSCPGRFIASNALKTMMAHIVMNYDVKLEGPRPENWWYATVVTPDPTVKILFRKRRN